MTLVSVITPSFNQGPFLRQAMQSVFAQVGSEIEYLIVDGGSTDGSVDIIREGAGRIAWWVSEPDSGQAEAINKGVAHSRGELLAWLNSDDYYLPGAVAAAVKALETFPSAPFVYASMQAVDEQGRLLNLLTYEQFSLEDLLCFRIIGQPAVFMRRDAFLRAGGLRQDMHLLLDHELWIRMALLGQPVYVNQVWAAARYHPAAKNRAMAARFGREAFQILDQASGDSELSEKLLPLRSRARASANRVDARYLLDAGLPGPALRAWIRSFIIHPPTALSRLNLLGAALLELAGLGRIRRYILRSRQQRLLH